MFPASKTWKSTNLFLLWSYIRSPCVPKMLKVIVFLSFTKGSFIKYWWPLICSVFWYEFWSNACRELNSWRNSWPKERLHRAQNKLTLLTFPFRPQSSVHLSLFYQVTKVTAVIFKSRLCVQVQPYRRATQQMKRSGKEYITHKPAIEWEHLKQLKARGSCSLFSLLYFKKSGSILFLPFVEDSVKDRELNHQKVQKCPPCAVCFQLFGKLFQISAYFLTW